MSSHELARGYTRPIVVGSVPHKIPDELNEAHEKLLAKRKLTKMLRSKTFDEPPISIGDMVEIYIKKQNEKRSKWSGPKPVLKFDPVSGTVTVPGQNGRQVCAAIEDVRISVANSKLSRKIQVSLDMMDKLLEEEIGAIETEVDEEEQNSNTTALIDATDMDIADEGPFETDTDLKVGAAIEVYWPLEEEFFPGTVSAYDAFNKIHTVSYNDGDVEELDMSKEDWRYTSTALEANNIEVSPCSELSRTEKESVEMFYKVFEHKEFSLTAAQGLPSHTTENAYKKEENKFMRTVRLVPTSQVPKDANIITSHVIYKVKSSDEGDYYLKARIAPHGNKDRERTGLKTDSATCPPVGIRIACSIATMFKWHLAKIDFESAFNNSGDAIPDVYVRPPRESKYRYRYLWLLLAASYGLVNANAKWQEAIDNFLSGVGFNQLVYVPQLFFKKKGDDISVIAVKIVDDILFACPLDLLKSVVNKISSKYKLGTIVYGPGNFRYNGLTISQDTDFIISIHADDKLEALQPYPIDRYRRKQMEEKLNAIELTSFRSLNSSISWIGVAASPFCSFASSYLQQKLPDTTVSDLVAQLNITRELKKLGSSLKFKRPCDKKLYSLSILVFADASRKEDRGQLGYICGLLIGDISLGSIYHTLSWSSTKAKRPVKSIGSAEVLATGAAIDEGKLISQAMSTLLNYTVDLTIVLDSKDLYDTISTCRLATDRSIRGDVALIRYEFETRKVSRMIWVPGKVNLSDPLRKRDSPIISSLQLPLFTGELPFNFKEFLARRSDRSTG